MTQSNFSTFKSLHNLILAQPNGTGMVCYDKSENATDSCKPVINETPDDAGEV